MPVVRRLPTLPEPERVFHGLYAESPNSFWLDSGAASATGERGRFSFMGDGEGPRAALITYDASAGLLRVATRAGTDIRPESVFDYLSRTLEIADEGATDLPFGFDCGLVGYLGYELKAECDGRMAHRSPTPDAAFVLADRLIAFDHSEECTYLVTLTDDGWVEATADRISELPPLPELPPLARSPSGDRLVREALRRSPERYLADIAACKRHLAAGHSYELCLTNKAVFAAPADPFWTYRSLRRCNPAPFAAFLRFGELAVLSSSPERFLRIGRDGWTEARPIKGTSRRGPTPREDARLAAALACDEKCRAENVTIVDLLRNDLGRVCEFGSVEVAELMRVETYETVHQLVSAVRGRLREGVSPPDCVRACFPPGSMTGAPKRRTTEILDRLEGEARGIYSGAIGYFGLGGECDLSVAIRTIAVSAGTATIGAGGAIVAQSDPEMELAEMLLKAAAPAAALLSRDALGKQGVSPLHPVV